MPWRIVVATNNPHKLRELQQIAAAVAPGELLFQAPADVLGAPWEGVEESGHTLEENAYLKATVLFERVWQPVVADDSGLEVEALGGKPGVDSAHFVGSDAENRRAVLELLRGVPAERRRARFRTVLCYRDALRTVCVEGIVEGWIALEERGEHGFGYDPIFVPDGEERTFAEMSPEEKNQCSHRFRAVVALLQYLRRLESDAELEEPQPPLVSAPWAQWLLRICFVAARGASIDAVEELTEHALRAGMPVAALVEALLQLSAFAGFPAAIEALRRAQAACRRLGVHWEEREPEGASLGELRARGEELFGRIYGEQAERVRERLRGAAPALEELVLRVAYGELLCRDGLALPERQWAALAALVAGQWWTQVHSHLRGLLRTGWTVEQCEEMLAVLQPLCTPEQWQRLQAEWERVRAGQVPTSGLAAAP